MIILFPTYAQRIPDTRQWQVHIAGMVSKPLPEQSRRRVFARAVLKRILRVQDAEIDTDLFRSRANAFFVQRLAGHTIQLSLAGQSYDGGQSDRSGHFQSNIILDDDTLHAFSEMLPSGCRWLPYEGKTIPPQQSEQHGTPESFTARGTIQCINAEGLSVISDIDDTVKISDVGNRRALLANTFLREFQAVPGMVNVFQHLQQSGAAFHYVSASPWQLSTSLYEFFSHAGLPAGSMHLKLFRLKDSTPLRKLPSRKRSKRRIIEKILADFPKRKFLFIGDSGERDPEVYTGVARRHPEQVHSVLIRKITTRTPSEKMNFRLARLASKLPQGMLQTFTHTEELHAHCKAVCQEIQR